MKSRFGLMAIGLVMLSAVLCGVVSSGDTYAKAANMDKAMITSKAMFEGMYWCGYSGNYRRMFTTDEVKDFATAGESTMVKLPYGFTSVQDNDLNCKEVLFGGSGYGGMFQQSNFKTPIATAEYFAGRNLKGNSDESLGYKAEDIGDNSSGDKNSADNLYYVSLKINPMSECQGAQLKMTQSYGTPTEYMNLNKDSTFTVDVPDNVIVLPGSNTTKFRGDFSGMLVPSENGEYYWYRFVGCNSSSYITVGRKSDKEYTIGGGDFSENAKVISSNVSIKANATKEQIAELSGKGISGIFSIGNATVTAGGANNVSDRYRLEYASSGIMAFLRGLSNKHSESPFKLSSVATYGNLALGKQEVYDLYTYYLSNVFQVPVYCKEDNDGYDDFESELTPVNWAAGKKCGARTAEHVNKLDHSVYGVNNSYHFMEAIYTRKGSRTDSDPLESGSIKKVIDILNSLGDLSALETESGSSAKGSLDIPTGGSDGGGDPCYDAGIEGMSWVLCPAINNMASAVDGIDGLIDSWLSVDSEYYTVGGSGETDKVWGYFRDIANWIMIIILLVIIFSQLTGVGINNYGIKKMLPKFVVMAILINLSFLICQLAIDLSNILGTSLNNMFQAIGREMYKESDFNSGAFFATSLVTVLLGAIAGGGTAVGAGMAIRHGGDSGAMVIISLCLTLLAAIVAVLMFFVALGARMIIIILFTAISPLAFACYILPNTQGLFKKWWDVYKAALLVYPICGALYGMSFLIRGLVFQGEVPFWMGIIAICAPFLPFVALPSLLRSAMSGLGKLGGALTSLGNGLRRGINNSNQTLRNTEAYKMQAAEGARRSLERNSSNTLRRLKEKQAKRDLSTREMRRMSNAQSTLNKLKAEDTAAQAALLSSKYSNRTDDDILELWEKAYTSGDEKGELEALTPVLIERFGDVGAAVKTSTIIADDNNRLVEKDGSKNQKILKSLGVMQSVMRNNGAYAQSMRDKAPDVNKMISSGGVVHYEDGKEPEYGNIDNKAFAPGHLSTAEDFAKLGKDAVERGGKYGWILPRDAQAVLESDVDVVKNRLEGDEGKTSAFRNIAYPGGVDSGGGDGAGGADSVASGGSAATGGDARLEAGADAASLKIDHEPDSAGATSTGGATSHANPQVVGGSVTTIYKDGTSDVEYYTPMAGHTKDGESHITIYRDSKKKR